MTRAVRRSVALAILGGALILARPAPAHAHPLGNFTVNLYSGLLFAPGGVRVEYVVDMAEIPTFQETTRIDADGDGAASEAELLAWARRTAAALAKGMTLTVDGHRVDLNLEEAAAGLRPGQGGLSILRLEAWLEAALPESGSLEYRDRNLPGRLGWREITARATGGAAIETSSVPADSSSDALRSYPEDLLASPVRVTRATVSFAPGRSTAAGISASAPTAGETGPGGAGGAFAALAARGTLSPAVVALSLVLALGFGALHALGPGHGKTVIAAYLLAGGGRIRHAVAVSGIVAAMHTASVLALGSLLLSAERAFPAEALYPWLGLISGAAALALGAGLLVTRLGGRARGHRHHDQHRHAHTGTGRPLSVRGLTALALSGGLLPSPTAIVVLLGATALGRVHYGLALVGAFSLGLAIALAVIGTLAVRAGTFLAPRMGRWARLLPLGSASAIAAMGGILVSRAAMQL